MGEQGLCLKMVNGEQRVGKVRGGSRVIKLVHRGYLSGSGS